MRLLLHLRNRIAMAATAAAAVRVRAVVECRNDAVHAVAHLTRVGLDLCRARHAALEHADQHALDVDAVCLSSNIKQQEGGEAHVGANLIQWILRAVKAEEKL